MRKKSAPSSRVKAATKIRWIDPDDAPEIDEAFLDLAEIKIDGVIVQKMRGRPALGNVAKRQITLRLDPDVIEAYRATGPGWQGQINADLRRIRKLKKTG